MDEKTRRYKMIEYDKDNFDGVIGNSDFLEDIIKSAKESQYKNIVSYEDKILANLLSNPKVEVRLRNDDLSSLDEVAKKSMIKKIQGLLGIKPLLNE